MSHVAVIGGGPAGLMAAEVLLAGGAAVTLFDHMPSLGRKLLMAGRGGLNLTHSEALTPFLERYGAAAEALRGAIEAFPPSAVRAWCEGLGQTTFIGSSGRVFPRTMKASPLLRAWLQRLSAAGLVVKPRHRWVGWNAAGEIMFATPAGSIAAQADATVLALGGASWPRLGSDGGWVDMLRREAVDIAPLRPANCGFVTGWSDVFKTRFEGEPLKRLAIRFGELSVRGEAIITAGGLEGGAVYALSAALREAIATAGSALISIDLKPDTALDRLTAALDVPRRKQSLASFLRKKAHLTPAGIGLLQEVTHGAMQRLSGLPAPVLAELIKAVPLRLTATAPIDRAISTAGGVALGEIDARYMLVRRPGTFVAGEMLDWEAPTGGYLLQACLATGAAAGRGVLDWLVSCHRNTE